MRSMRDTPTDSDFVGRGQEGSAKSFRRRAGQPDREKLRAPIFHTPASNSTERMFREAP